MRSVIDARSELIARHGELGSGSVGMATALDWWNRGWVEPASFDPLDWRITDAGLHQIQFEDGPPRGARTGGAAAAADRATPCGQRGLSR